jgi:hypothetical protein
MRDRQLVYTADDSNGDFARDAGGGRRLDSLLDGAQVRSRLRLPRQTAPAQAFESSGRRVSSRNEGDPAAVC